MKVEQSAVVQDVFLKSDAHLVAWKLTEVVNTVKRLTMDVENAVDKLRQNQRGIVARVTFSEVGAVNVTVTAYTEEE